MADLVLLLHRNLSKGLGVALWLENWIPAKHIFTSGRYNFSIAFSNKYDWLVSFSLAERESALGVGGLVFKILDHLVETLSPNTRQKILNVGSRQSFHGIEAQRHIFDHDSSIAVICSLHNLVLGDTFGRALQLLQIVAMICDVELLLEM